VALSENLRVKGGDMRDAKGLVRVTIFAGLALMTVSSAVRIAMAQEKGGGDVTGPTITSATGHCRCTPMAGRGVRFADN